jgi:hypothetical protein
MELGHTAVNVNEGNLGRILSASILISPGTEIFTCTSSKIAVDASPEVLKNHCFWCGQLSNSLIVKCCNCDAHFCASCGEGRDLHGQECGLITEYRILTGTPLVRQGVLALRLLLHKQQHSDNYVNIFDLVGEAMDCDETRQDLAKAMKQASENYSARCSSDDDAKVCESKLLQILDIMHRNAFKSGDIITVFPMLSLMNHSCMPNSVATIGYEKEETSGNFVLVASVRALRTIAIGEEVTISYYPLGLSPTAIRQEAIYEKHGFCCGCEACCGDACDNAADKILLEQQETHFGGVELTLDPLIVVFDSIEEELASIGDSNTLGGVGAEEKVASQDAQEEDKFNDLHFLLTRAEAGIKNLKLGKLHYLTLKLLVLSAETALLEQRRQEVIRHCQEWLRLMDTSSASCIQKLCDVHLKCRMLVIYADCLADIFESQESGVLGKTKKNKNKLIDALSRAIALAAMIYGDEYSLCRVLKKRKEKISDIVIV